MAYRDDAAKLLIEARADHRLIDALDLNEIPDMDAAYDIAAAAIAGTGEKVLGWKIGLTDPTPWPKFNATEPMYAPVLSSVCRSSGDKTSVGPGLFGIECEYAFSLKGAIPARSNPYHQDEVVAAIGEIFPAIEVVGLRQRLAMPADVRLLTADFGVNMGFVSGTRIAFKTAMDILNQEVSAIINGEVKARGKGANVFGHPLSALTWMVNKVSSRGINLKEGQFITTGTCVGIVPVRSSDKITADFGPLGSVSTALQTE